MFSNLFGSANKPTSVSDTSITFKVDYVDVEKKAPFVQTAQEALLSQGIQTEKIEDFSHKKISEANIAKSDMSGFMAAIHTAYQCHYNLKLSVSDFIILIGQGLSRHIEVNAEKLRKHFVNHEGKEKIQIRRDEFVKGQENDWSTVFGDFADEIKKRVKADVHGVIIDDTSVATPTTRIVSEIALMDAMKSYFKYEVMTLCGIPQVTLEGTTEDWQKLKDKVQKLVEMNKNDALELKWWLDKLVPVVDKICEAGINRKIDIAFWKEIYKHQGGSGGPFITGWITTFFPYLTDNVVNKLSGERIHSHKIPKQISQVPFIWNYMGNEIPMTFYGGFVGAEFERDNSTLKPVHFWSVNYNE